MSRLSRFAKSEPPCHTDLLVWNAKATVPLTTNTSKPFTMTSIVPTLSEIWTPSFFWGFVTALLLVALLQNGRSLVSTRSSTPEKVLLYNPNSAKEIDGEYVAEEAS